MFSGEIGTVLTGCSDSGRRGGVFGVWGDIFGGGARVRCLSIMSGLWEGRGE